MVKYIDGYQAGYSAGYRSIKDEANTLAIEASNAYSEGLADGWRDAKRSQEMSPICCDHCLYMNVDPTVEEAVYVPVFLAEQIKEWVRIGNVFSEALGKLEPELELPILRMSEYQDEPIVDEMYEAGVVPWQTKP